MAPSLMPITQLLSHCVSNYMWQCNENMSRADKAVALANWMYMNGGDNTARLLAHFGDKLESEILKVLDEREIEENETYGEHYKDNNPALVSGWDCLG